MPTLLYSPGACSLAAHIILEWIGAATRRSFSVRNAHRDRMLADPAVQRVMAADGL